MKRRSAEPDAKVQRRTAVHDAYVRNESSLKRFIRRFFHHRPDIDDIAQETFLRAYAAELGRPPEHPINEPKAFLFRIAKHVALDELSRKSRQMTDYIEDPAGSTVISTETSAEEEVSARQILGIHCEAVASLPPQCRQVYLLRKVHGLSHKEIAKQLGITVSTVEKHLIKAVELCDRYVRDKVSPAVGRAARRAP